MNANGQALDYREHYLGTKPLRVGGKLLCGPQTLVWQILSGTVYDRRSVERTPMPSVADAANQMMDTLHQTLPDVRELRVERLGKVLAATEGEELAREVVRVVGLRGRTLGWWP